MKSCPWQSLSVYRSYLQDPLLQNKFWVITRFIVVCEQKSWEEKEEEENKMKKKKKKKQAVK